MSPEEFARKMEVLAVALGGDPEMFHSEADDLLCSVLRDLGYGAGVEIFKKTEKWYA